MTDSRAAELVELLDWRRRVAELYAEVRATPDHRAAWMRWHQERSRLFHEHSQSPVPGAERRTYRGPHVYAYDSAWRVLAMVQSVEPARLELPSSGPGPMSFTRFARAEFTIGETPLSLDLYWLDGYGGGLFVPFADLTSGRETYGAGRYVLDSIKGADLGQQDDLLVLDFNYAYQPSCSYDPGWACPLAPRANRLAVPIRAGERLASSTA